MQGHKPESEAPPEPVTSLPPTSSGNSFPPQDDLYRPKLDSSFAIDSLLHSLRPISASGDLDMASGDCWGEVTRARPSPAPQHRYTSSARSASASSASPASTSSSSSSSSDEEWKGVTGKRVPPDVEAGGDICRPPLQKSARRETVPPPWELPTSYAKYAPPNVVAPPSMRFNGGPLMPLHSGLPIYGYGSSPMTQSHFLGHTYWPILPTRQVSVRAPPLLMDLDNMLQSVPPNKSVFDVLVPASQNSHPHYQQPGQYSLQNGAPLNRYHQYWVLLSLKQDTKPQWQTTGCTSRSIKELYFVCHFHKLKKYYNKCKKQNSLSCRQCYQLTQSFIRRWKCFYVAIKKKKKESVWSITWLHWKKTFYNCTTKRVSTSVFQWNCVKSLHCTYSLHCFFICIYKLLFLTFIIIFWMFSTYCDYWMYYTYKATKNWTTRPMQ